MTTPDRFGVALARLAQAMLQQEQERDALLRDVDAYLERCEDILDRVGVGGYIEQSPNNAMLLRARVRDALGLAATCEGDTK